MEIIRINSREDNKAQGVARSVPDNQSIVKGLVNKAIDGDTEAFGELYSIFLDRIFNYTYHLLEDRMKAEDITEEVFLKAWKAIKSCKGKEQTFSSWLYRIAHNQVIDVIRSNRKHIFLEIEAADDTNRSGTDPGRELETKLEYRNLMKSIYGLPEQQRQVIIFKFIEGIENKEIGEIMGKSQGAVRILQMRALNSIRKTRG